MTYIADLHIHSHYSRATSKASHLHGLAAWAAIKGIDVVGTGDFTHPGWFAHLHQYLEAAEPGFFRLKPDQSYDYQALLPQGMQPANDPAAIRFVLSAEISSIYKRGGQVRKVHNLLYAPDFESVQRINATLATIGNIGSDGRPILGLDSRDLLEILLEKAPEGFLVPAHIWTPWFSLFGSKSGFDTIEECFGDLSDQIFALETGLSSDPEMNRMISALDRFTLLSNSDCHSPAKLGREANVFTTGFDYFSMREAIRNPVNRQGKREFDATIEFYPEEGKYHCDGHRNCGVCLEPAATRKVEGLCPACGKPLTIGVLHRVMALADRPQAVFPASAPKVYSLIPLQEIVAELLDCGPATKKAIAGYVRLINTFGSEFRLLLDTPVEEIGTQASPLLAEAIKRVRDGRVIRRAGYDGEFGVITVFSEGERAALCGQGSLFGAITAVSASKVRKKNKPLERLPAAAPAADPMARGLNCEQQRAVDSDATRILVQAGPGTGKTHTLVSRVLKLAAASNRPCTVITFTNKAAAELRERLQVVIATGAPLTVATFHGYCLAQLRRDLPELQVAGPEERADLLTELFPELGDKARGELSRTLSLVLRQAAEPVSDPELHRYLQVLAERSQIDIEAVVPRTVALLQQGGATAAAIRAATGHLLVDEFQDVNQAQYTLVAELAATSTIFAIGDPDQAIYGFRGADPKWFHAFIDAFQPECHQLLRNYRSAPTLIRAAEQLIDHNPHLLPVAAMQACSQASGAIYVQGCSHPEAEAAFIADQIELQVGGTSHRNLERFDDAGSGQVSFRDIGVLFRTSRQTEALSTILAARGIPFQLVDLEAYYTKGPSRLLYCWMLLLGGRASVGHLLFLLGQEPGIGSRSLQRLQVGMGSSLRAMEPGLLVPGDLGLEGAAGAALARFRSLHEHLLLMLAAEQPVSSVLLALMEYYRMDPQAAEPVRLRELALTFGHSLAAFAAHLQLFSDSVIYDPRAEAVTLSTLHASKGLEFPVVFIAGLEQGLLPLTLRQPQEAASGREHLEEERRLFYVGMTRAIATLYLTWCVSRPGYDGSGETRQRSQFLAELPPTVGSAPPISRPAAPRRKAASRQLSLFS
ncbi:MAG: UvrD-helicase domain-containing protein [Desulfobulbaceae bacterium]|nr:UvrD-helicase domain-containing protein [Desulfobulbaceae bacterium]